MDVEPLEFEFLTSPGSKPVIVADHNYELAIISTDGQTIRRMKVNHTMGGRYALVRFDSKKEPYLCVMGHIRYYMPYSVLYIFNPDGELVYRRLVGKNKGLATFPLKDGSEALLAGDGASVYFYKPTDKLLGE